MDAPWPTRCLSHKCTRRAIGRWPMCPGLSIRRLQWHPRPVESLRRDVRAAQLGANHSNSFRAASLRAKCCSLLLSAPRASACQPLFLSRTAQLVLVFQASGQQNPQHRREVRFSTNSTPPPRHASLVGLPCTRGSGWLGLSCSESLDARTKQWSVRETCNAQHGQNAT